MRRSRGELSHLASDISGEASSTLEAFITLGDSISLADGTDEFVSDALDALGIDASPSTWELEYFRTHYFSSSRHDSGDWEEDWDLVWRLRATFDMDPPPEIPEPPIAGFFDLEAVDRTFEPEDMPHERDSFACLLLADGHDEDEIDAAASVVTRSHPDAEIVRGRAYGRHPQLRCSLGVFPRSYYEEGATSAEETLKALQETGVAVRFEDLQPMPD